MAVIAIDVGFNDSIDAIKAYRKQLGASSFTPAPRNNN
jgi:hypothetical protein